MTYKILYSCFAIVFFQSITQVSMAAQVCPTTLPACSTLQTCGSTVITSPPITYNLNYISTPVDGGADMEITCPTTCCSAGDVYAVTCPDGADNDGTMTCGSCQTITNCSVPTLEPTQTIQPEVEPAAQTKIKPSLR